MSKGVVRKIIKTDTVPPPVGPYKYVHMYKTCRWCLYVESFILKVFNHAMKVKGLMD